MCRVRSIREVAKYFHDMDPGTQLTEWTIRNMISEGTIPAVSILSILIYSSKCSAEPRPDPIRSNR